MKKRKKSKRIQLSKKSRVIINALSGINNAQLKVVENVLNQYLKRKPKDQDFKDCIKIYENENSSNFILSHRNVLLGKIETVSTNGKITVNFDPTCTSF